MEKNVYQLLQEWHELLKKEIITNDEFQKKKLELLGSARMNTFQKEKEQETIKTPREEIDPEYVKLFGNKTRNRKNKRLIIVLILLTIGISILYFIKNIRGNYQLKYNIDKISFYSARGFYDQSVKVKGQIIEYNNYFIINISGNEHLNSINDTLWVDKNEEIENGITRYILIEPNKNSFGETDLFFDNDTVQNILIRRYKVKDFNDTTKVIYHYTNSGTK